MQRSDSVGEEGEEKGKRDVENKRKERVDVRVVKELGMDKESEQKVDSGKGEGR